MDKTMLKFRIEGTKRTLMAKVKPVTDMATHMIKEHPVETLGAVTTALMMAERGVRRHDQNKKAKMDEIKRRRGIYDHSGGHYFIARRDITPEEWGEIDYRHKKLEEGYYSILKDMDLL